MRGLRRAKVRFDNFRERLGLMILRQSMLRIRGYDFTRAQSGRWVCDCCFTVETGAQFSREEHVIRGRGRYLITALIHSRRLAQTEARILTTGAKEQRAAKGWR